MSLRAFHIVFVASVVLLLMFLSYWNYTKWDSLSYMIISLVVTVLTIFYGIKFYSKTEELSE